MEKWVDTVEGKTATTQKKGHRNHQRTPLKPLCLVEAKISAIFGPLPRKKKKGGVFKAKEGWGGGHT